MAKNEDIKVAPIVIPNGLELDPEWTPIASDDESVTVEKDGKKFRVSAGDGNPVAWNWVEVA